MQEEHSVPLIVYGSIIMITRNDINYEFCDAMNHMAQLFIPNMKSWLSLSKEFAFFPPFS